MPYEPQKTRPSPVRKIQNALCPVCKAEYMRYRIVAHCDTCNRTFIPRGREHTAKDEGFDHPHYGLVIRQVVTQQVDVLENNGQSRRCMTLTWEM